MKIKLVCLTTVLFINMAAITTVLLAVNNAPQKTPANSAAVESNRSATATFVSAGMRPIVETKTKLINYTVMTPVYERHQKEVSYTVMKPVYETKEKTVTYTVCTMVPETQTKTIEYTTCRMVPEAKQKSVVYQEVRYVPIDDSKIESK